MKFLKRFFQNLFGSNIRARQRFARIRAFKMRNEVILVKQMFNVNGKRFADVYSMRDNLKILPFIDFTEFNNYRKIDVLCYRPFPDENVRCFYGDDWSIRPEAYLYVKRIKLKI